MNLNEGQDHPNWYQNVELSGLYQYHNTKFEKNKRSAYVWKQASVKISLLKSNK